MKEPENKASTGDYLHGLAKGAIGAVPVIGSLASEIFGMVVTPPLEKRRAEWMNDIAERLDNLEKESRISFPDLKENDEFIDVVLQATTYALKTHEEAKIEALKCAVLNSALGESPGNTKAQIFLNHLDRFTPLHLQVLNFFNDPEQWYAEQKINPPSIGVGSLFSLFSRAYPEFSRDEQLVCVVWDDLHKAGFHHTASFLTTMSGHGLMADRTTQLGKEFLAFISSK